MSILSISPRSSADAKQVPFIDELQRRAQATPPGACPLAVQLSLLQSGALQTCGKCVPCRDGLPQLAATLRKIMECEASPDELAAAKRLAQSVQATADCAIGWHAAEVFLQGLEEFSDEYESHVTRHACTQGIGQTVPCETFCPAHVDIPSYIAYTGKQDYDSAIRVIRKDNPFPTACAFICEHPCEKRCRRALIDAPLNIRGIKKFAVDELHADKVGTPEPLPASGRKVAIIGGGPSGLTCAYYLALMGHKVSVLEMRKSLGGMMRYGIPAYRFPRERLDEDIRAIVGAGDIEVSLNHRVDTAEMERLVAEYDAVYVAIGAQGGKTLRLGGSADKGVMSAVEMLERIGDGDYPDFTGKRVVVVGGGNVAMDCARTSVRAGAANVTVAYRRRIEDMTALPEEVAAAVAEGVEIRVLQAPARLEADEQGNVTALVCQPQMIGPVKGGRPAPLAANKPEVVLPADVVLIAVGQDIQSQPFEQFGMQAIRTYFVTDDHLRAEGYENVFVGGDCQTGPKSAIMAIGAGKVAARNIDAYLGYSHKLNCGVEAPPPDPNDRGAYGRVQIEERPAGERKLDFDEVELSMSLEEAIQECGRCLRCDHYGCGVVERGRVQYV